MSLRPLTIAACIIFIITNHVSELKFLKNLWGLQLLSTFAFSWALHIHDVSFHGNFKSCAVCCIFVLCPSNQIYRLKIKECVSPRIKKKWWDFHRVSSMLSSGLVVDMGSSSGSLAVVPEQKVQSSPCVVCPQDFPPSFSLVSCSPGLFYKPMGKYVLSIESYLMGQHFSAHKTLLSR